MTDEHDTSSDEQTDTSAGEQDDNEKGELNADEAKAKAEADEALKAKKEADREKAKQGTINSVKAKMANNESIPNDQLWAVKHLEESEAEKTPEPVDLDAHADKIYERVKERQQLDKDIDFIDSLPDELRDELQDDVKVLEKGGMNSANALKFVVDKNSERIEKEIGHIETRRQGAGMPARGIKTDANTISQAQLTSLAMMADRTKYNQAKEKIEAGKLTKV